MSKATDKKSLQLGMPFGNARTILVRTLMFTMIQQLGKDVCYRCKQRIERAEEFSIDHKEPWQDVSTDLFWDINNIAFSHRGCNSRAARRDMKKVNDALAIKNKQLYESGPENTSWCVGHQNYRPLEDFSKNKSRKRGLQMYCNDCRSIGVGRQAGATRASVTQTAECLTCNEDVAGATPASSPS